MMTNHSITPPVKTAKQLPTIETTWSLRTYDVWGNAKDGYEVNQSYNQGEITMRIPQTRHNVGTPHEFISAYPTHRQIKKAVGISCRIDTDGDDLHIEVNKLSDGKPLCELHCTSHESLSPVRPIAE